MRPGYFLCGCSSLEERAGYTRRWDNAGLPVCPEHGSRMYGWIEQVRARVSTSPGGVSVNVEDRRDRQDPQKLGLMLLEERGEWNWDKEMTLSALHDELRLEGVKAPPYRG